MLTPSSRARNHDHAPRRFPNVTARAPTLGSLPDHKPGRFFYVHDQSARTLRPCSRQERTSTVWSAAPAVTRRLSRQPTSASGASVRSRSDTTTRRSRDASRARASQPGRRASGGIATCSPSTSRNRADHARRRVHAADPRTQPRRRAGTAQPLPEERHAESHRLVQGPRRERRGDVGAAARAHHDRVRQHGEPRQLRRRVCGTCGTARRRRRAQRPRAREDDRHLHLPPDAHRRRRQLRRRQPPLQRARRLRGLGLLQPQPARLSTARAARRSRSRPPNSSAGASPTRSSSRSRPDASSSSTARRRAS